MGFKQYLLFLLIILLIHSYVTVLGLHCCCTNFPLAVAISSYSLVWFSGFSWGLLLLQSMGGCGSQALEHRRSSCGPRAESLLRMWDLHRPQMEPVSPASVGRFFTTEPLGKPSSKISSQREDTAVPNSFPQGCMF